MPADAMSETALDRFIRYVKIDTQSQEGVEAYPSTQKQLELLKLLLEELDELGLSDARMDEYGYVTATIPANLPGGSRQVPTIGLIAHVDTSPSFTGANVKPQIICDYAGGDIVLPGVVIQAAENPELAQNLGKTIVTSDGTTLLGADDKAGVAIIMTVAQTLIETPSMAHGRVRIAFTPDEEVGNGTKFFDLQAFGGDFAYTVDGGTPGELNRETFSADSAVITVHGRNIHPGDAQGIMVNSLRAIADVVVRMPKDMAPETTAERQPFIHPQSLEAQEAKSTLNILLRDFETDGLRAQAEILRAILAEVQSLHPRARFELAITESYRNMRDALERYPRVTEALWEATKRAGFGPKWVPIRGGTDGSRLTEKGLPTPNVFTGGQNYHGPMEWLSVEGMNKSVETILHLLQIWAEEA
jgi:tripeptide aminopeptidase